MINVDRKRVDAPSIDDSWRTPQILDALGIVFFNKCYLCELKYLNPDDFQVEHFRERASNDELKRDWSNLYLACGNCNSIEPKKAWNGGYLDPCADEDDVETLIKYKFYHGNYDNPRFSPASPLPNIKTINSVNLLTRLHQGHNPNTKRKTASLRELINRRAKKLIKTITLHQQALNKNDHEAARQNETQIRRYLSRQSPFTMLMRCIGSRYNYAYLFD